MDSWFLGPTQYSPDRWAICLRDRSRQLTATPHRGRAIGAVLAISPNAATAREAIRLIELEDIAPASDFFILQIAELPPAKKVLLSNEYRQTGTLSMRLGSGDVRVDCRDTHALIALHAAMIARVEAIWHEGSLQIIPDAIDEGKLTRRYADGVIELIRQCHVCIQSTLALAEMVDECETRIAALSEDEDDHSRRLHADPDYHDMLTALDQHSSELDTRIREIARRLIAVGIATFLNPEARPFYVQSLSKAKPQLQRFRSALNSAAAKLALHARADSWLQQTVGIPTDRQDTTSSTLPPQFPVAIEEPNWLVVDGKRFVCAIAPGRMTVLRALIASGGSISAAAFGKKGAYCLWPNHTYPPGESQEASSRRKALEKSLSPTLSRLNDDLRNLRLPRALTARLVKGTVILEIA